MTQRLFAAAALALLLASAPLAAIYMRMETREVPIDRLVPNLERELKADPDNSRRSINLARLHAMAYALKVDDLPAARLETRSAGGTVVSTRVERGSGRCPPGAFPPRPPRRGSAPQEVVRHYGAALTLAPDDLTARLGHGWVLQQSGDTPAAITAYRMVIAQAWPGEQKIEALDAVPAVLHGRGR